MESLKLTSPVFKENQPIPSRYTCEGLDINPALGIEQVPSEAQSLALIMDDPDAPGGTWVHWVLWNINPTTSELREGSVPPGARQGINDFKKNKYGGPCPPSGIHRYFFKLYALDTKLDLPEKKGKAALEAAMKGHVLAHAELVALYGKK